MNCMRSPLESAEADQRPIGRVLKAIALRVVALGAMALLAFLLVGDLRSLVPLRSAPRRTAAENQVAPDGPGWPHRRGPQYDGRSDETGLADAWPAEGPPVLWTLDLGRGYSGITAVGDRAFTQIQSLTGQSVLCLDGDTGQPLWSHRYGWPYEPGGMYPGPRATPTWHEGRVYFAGPRGLVGCLRAGDGGVVWRVNVNERFDGRGTDFGYSCSPLVEDGKVILPVGGEGASVVALDARDGSTVWASGDEPASYCSAMPITFHGRRCVVAFLQNALALFDLRSGRLLCQDTYSTGYDEHAADPIYDEPYLMIACPFQSGAQCYRLEVNPPEGGDLESAEGDSPIFAPRKLGQSPVAPRKSGQSQGSLSLESVWGHRKLSNDVASCVLVDGYVYGFDLRDIQAKAHRPSRGKFKCLELTTGDVRWSTDRVGHASVIAADGKLILFNDKGELLLARANPEGYEELACTQIFTDEICWTAPTLHRGRVYLRSPSKAACVYLGRPEDLGREQRQRAAPASELARSRRMNLTRLVGGERQYAFDPAGPRELGLWYAFSLGGVLAPAAIVGSLISLLAGIWWPRRARGIGRAVFWCAAFMLGAAGTPVYNRLWGEFVFTWPVCLLVAHQIAINAITWAGRQADSKWARWVSLLATFCFLAVCLQYYLVCRRLSLATEWLFLLGFLPSWPLAVPAARLLRRERPVWVEFLWAGATFSAYFWAAGGILIAKAAAGGV